MTTGDNPCDDQLFNPCLGPFVERLGDYASGGFGTSLRGERSPKMVSTAVPNTLRLFTVVTITAVTTGIEEFRMMRGGRP